MVDALSKLREYVMSGNLNNVEKVGDEVHFGDLSFSKTSETNFMKWRLPLVKLSDSFKFFYLYLTVLNMLSLY